MRLLVDIGNTCLKWAVVHDQVMSPQHSVVHRDQELSFLFQQLWSELPAIQTVWVANVAGDVACFALTHWVWQRWQITPRFVSSVAQAYGVHNGYQQPEQLGVDRWLALIGSHALADEAVCIADCGTAITVDVLLATGIHLGGMIAPGIAMMQKALSMNTAALNQLTDYSNDSLTLEIAAVQTKQGIVSGVHYMAIGFLNHVLMEIEKKYHQSFILVMTGGDAPILLPYLSKTYRHIPDLVLQGLKIIADKHL